MELHYKGETNKYYLQIIIYVIKLNRSAKKALV